MEVEMKRGRRRRATTRMTLRHRNTNEHDIKILSQLKAQVETVTISV